MICALRPSAACAAASSRGFPKDATAMLGSALRWEWSGKLSLVPSPCVGEDGAACWRRSGVSMATTSSSLK